MDIDDLYDRVDEALEATDLTRARQLLDRAGDEFDELDTEDQRDLSQLWVDLADAYADRGRFDDAVAAIERCLELEYDASHDLRASLGGYRLRAGDEDAAADLWEAVKTEHPDDVGAMVLAALAYQDEERPADALPWLDAALEVILRHGDQEGWLIDVLTAREEALQDSGREEDALQQRGRALFGQQVRQRGGEDPVIERRIASRPAFPWWPPSEWDEATGRWPEVGGGHDDYRTYVRDVQAALLRTERDTARPVLAPLFLDAYETWCEAHARDPREVEAAHAYAAEVARLGNEVPWPPGRNEPCWCGSGTKYKKCCASVSLDE